MKKIQILILLFFYFSSFSQNEEDKTDFSLNAYPINKTIYRNISNSIAFEDTFDDSFNIDSIKIVPNDSCFITKPKYGIFIIEPRTNSPTIFLEFYYKNKLIGKELFRIKDSDNPKLYSYQINNKLETTFFDDNLLKSEHSKTEICKIRELRLTFDFGTGINGITYQINSFEYQIIRDGKVICAGENYTEMLSNSTITDFENIKSRDLLLILNIDCELKNGKDKRRFNYEIIIIK